MMSQTTGTKQTKFCKACGQYGHALEECRACGKHIHLQQWLERLPDDKRRDFLKQYRANRKKAHENYLSNLNARKSLKKKVRALYFDFQHSLPAMSKEELDINVDSAIRIAKVHTPNLDFGSLDPQYSDLYEPELQIDPIVDELHLSKSDDWQSGETGNLLKECLHDVFYHFNDDGETTLSETDTLSSRINDIAVHSVYITDRNSSCDHYHDLSSIEPPTYKVALNKQLPELLWHKTEQGWDTVQSPVDEMDSDDVLASYSTSARVNNVVLQICKAPNNVNSTRLTVAKAYISTTDDTSQSDTGANANITPHINLLSDVYWFSPVTIGNAQKGGSMTVEAIGKYPVATDSGVLKINMYYCPSAANTIISPSAICL